MVGMYQYVCLWKLDHLMICEEVVYFLVLLCCLNVNATTYIAPAHPSELVIPVGEALYVATRLHKDHTDALRAFRKSIDVQKALTKQIS